MQYSILKSGLANAKLVRLTPSVWLTMIYIVLSSIWILLSDSAASYLAGSDTALFERIQGLKGIFFVLLSGTVLYLLSIKLYNGLQHSNQQKTSIEKKIHALKEAAREGVFDYDIKSNKASLNNRMRFFFPTSTGEISGFWEIYKDKVHPDDMTRVADEYSKVISENKQLWQTELRLKGKDNIYYTVISSNYVIRNNQTGEPEQLIGTVLDVSALRNLQAEYYEQKLKHKRTLANSIIRAQENERNRWAQELHDNVCQILAVASMYASDLTKEPGKASQLGPELQKLVAESLGEIRQLSASIKTHSFTKETLGQSLEKLAANINRIKPFNFELTTTGFNESCLSPDQKLMIYRIAQEQLSNIMKYAEATEVKVTLSQTENENAAITVTDNGKGFDRDKIKTGIGLQNIRSRLQVFGGNLIIDSAPGNGCRLCASFKLNEH